MNTLNNLDALLTHLRKERQKVGKMLSRFPEGRLMISTSGKDMCFFDVTPENNKRKLRMIGKDPDLVLKLARKRYLEETASRLDQNISVLEKALKRSISLEQADILEAMPRHFDLFDPHEIIFGRNNGNWPNPSRDPSILPHAPLLKLEGISAAEWAAEPYRENTAYLQFKTHYTARGIACRSKAEAAILGIYDSKRFFYHSDETLIIDGELISPDVIAVREDGVIIYHEHCSMLSLRYNERLWHKLQLYEKAGIIPGKNLILTFDDERGNLNLALIEAQIDDMFFRQIRGPL